MQQSQNSQSTSYFIRGRKSAESSNSGSETDLSTSNESLSKEQRYVLKNMSRIEPQGQENQTESEKIVFFFYVNLFFNGI